MHQLRRLLPRHFTDWRGRYLIEGDPEGRWLPHRRPVLGRCRPGAPRRRPGGDGGQEHHHRPAVPGRSAPRRADQEQAGQNRCPVRGPHRRAPRVSPIARRAAGGLVAVLRPRLDTGSHAMHNPTPQDQGRTAACRVPPVPRMMVLILVVGLGFVVSACGGATPTAEKGTTVTSQPPIVAQAPTSFTVTDAPTPEVAAQDQAAQLGASEEQYATCFTYRGSRPDPCRRHRNCQCPCCPVLRDHRPHTGRSA